MPRTLLVVTPTFFPERIGTPHYVTDIAEWFTERGWRVRVVTAQPFYPEFERYPGYGRDRRHDRMGDIDVLRVPTIVPRGGRPLWRALSESNFALQCLLRAPGLRERFVLSVSPGVPWASAAGRAFRRPGGVHVALVHDIQSGLADALGLTRRMIVPAIQANERLSLQRADHVAVLTEEMGAAVRHLGVTRPIHVVPLWATVHRGPEADDRVAAPETVQYSGNFGEKQGVTILLDLAAELANRSSARLLLRGSGDRFERLRADATVRRLNNIDYEAPVDLDQLGPALAKSAVHVVVQAPGSSSYAMPSKVVNALACGCEVVAMADHASPLARLANQVQGLTVVPPGEVETMTDHVLAGLTRSQNRERRGVIAAASLRYFERNTVLESLESILLAQTDSQVTEAG